VSVDEFIDSLSAEAREAVRPLLQQAYDRGFREALASAGQPAVPQPPVVQPVPAAAAPAVTPVAWAGRVEADPDDPPGDEGDGGEGDDDDADEAPVQRPILPHATIGTLRRRIIRTFDLERFEIDVVICRSGDPDRRQLQNRVRLKAYRREEG
jgi:hypothetical protein